jgi:hypothetical protein
MKNSNNWNQLLIHARKKRGPFWDPNTNTLQVPKYTKWYYQRVNSAGLSQWPQEPYYADLPKSSLHEDSASTDSKKLKKDHSLEMLKETAAATNLTPLPLWPHSAKIIPELAPTTSATSIIPSPKDSLRITIKLPETPVTDKAYFPGTEES